MFNKMNKIKWLLRFTVGYLVFFGIIALLNRNYEFLYYIAVISGLVFIVLLYHKQIQLSTTILAGLSFVGLLHVLGGSMYFDGVRLYDIWLFPHFFKYDNLVHFSGLFIATLVAYNLLYPHLDQKLYHHPLLLSLLLVLVASGIGAINEILELGAVLYLNAGPDVGDYLNNAFDLLFNLLGAIFACAFIMWRRTK